MAIGSRRARRRKGRAEDRGPIEDHGRGHTGAGRRAAGSGLLLIARVVLFAALLVALIIGAAILLRVLDANTANSIVKAVHDAGKALVGPFEDIFKIDKPKVSVAVNWGLAALVYLLVGGLIARVLRRVALRSHPDRTV